jgi:hypothetical protein
LADTPSTKPLIDKLGVKHGMTATLINVDEPTFLAELESRASVSTGKPPPDQDIIFFGVESADDMPRLAELRNAIKPNGAVWVVFRKGRKDFNENDVLRLGLESGLVDVKIVRFSDTHSATKFVIRVRDR